MLYLVFTANPLCISQIKEIMSKQSRVNFVYNFQQHVGSTLFSLKQVKQVLYIYVYIKILF